jgi:hypothetical protein
MYANSDVEYSTSLPQGHAAGAQDILPLLEAEARERQLAGKGADGSGGRGNKKTLPSNLTEGFDTDPAGGVEKILNIARG